MNIYHLYRDSDRVLWDEAAGFVIVAASEHKARDVAIRNKGDEDAHEWLHCRVEFLGPAFLKEERMVLRDYNAG